MGDNNIDVLARIERVVREHPDADALRSADGVVPFSELWSRAQGLACRLQELGVRPGDAVGLCVPRSGDLVVGALGIVYAGGCYVAMDPAYPDERLSFMVAESGAQIVVGAADIAGRIDPAHIVDPQQPAPGAPPTRRTIDAGDPAYIVYTSGSTGRPKGVLIEHAGLANLVDWHIDAFALTSSDRTAFMSNPGFDAAVWEIWPSLAAGACLSIPADDIKVDPIALRDWLVTQHITTTFVPTALCDELLALDWPASAALRAMLTGGDVLHRRPRIGLPFRVVNNYGVSEASVVSTSGTVLPADPAADSTDLPTLGSPISGVTLTVVDADGRPVTPGSEGELVIGGVSVGRGYVGHPVHNHGRFFLDADGRRCYRTGDLVCLRPDGELVHLGRLDEQVSIRGLRIELGEITAVLDQHPKVRASAVVAVGSNGSQRLRAFIVGAPGRPPATAELREFLSKRLPAHMIPDDCIMLDELPVTANGKIDRNLLRDSGFDIAGRGDLMAPRNEFEEILVEIVAERLWLPAIGVDEDFFALGGHSMLGAQLSVRIGERFGIEVPLRSVFDNPTVVEMAVEVERLMVADIESMSDDELLEAGALFDAMPRDEEFAG